VRPPGEVAVTIALTYATPRNALAEEGIDEDPWSILGLERFFRPLNVSKLVQIDLLVSRTCLSGDKTPRTRDA